jgi:putative ABC transport system ATP-binding protein
LDEATSALDAESETLVNEALVALLRGNNTTISIAHRLSTIRRSDRIIVIGSDGTIVEEGSYKQLSTNPDGAFSKLMKWQISGEEEPPRVTPRPTQKEEIEYDLEKDDDEILDENIEKEVEDDTKRK